MIALITRNQWKRLTGELQAALDRETALKTAIDDTRRDLARQQSINEHAQAQIADLRARLEHQERMAPAPEFNPEQIDEQFSMAPESPMFRAVHAFVSEAISAEIQRATQPGLSDEQRQHLTGRAAGLLDLQRDMLGRVAMAANAAK